MMAGLPGTGLGGMFYVGLTLAMPFRELYRAVRGKSNAKRWSFIGVQLGFVAAIVAGMWGEAWALGRLIEWCATLDEAVRQIGEWFAGERRGFELPIDLRVSDWDRRVLTGAARLQYGETASYGELARHVGKPGAARAVGGAMGRNPVPILIPCHRVIAGDGTLGGYGGSNYADRRASLEIKRRLLAIEGTTVRE